MKKRIMAIMMAVLLGVNSWAVAGMKTAALGVVTSINQYGISIVQVGDETFGFKDDSLQPGDEVILVIEWDNRTQECSCGNGGDLFEIVNIEVIDRN